jgi:hypothetical protein
MENSKGFEKKLALLITTHKRQPKKGQEFVAIKIKIR